MGELVLESRDLYPYYATTWYIATLVDPPSRLAVVINARETAAHILTLARGEGPLPGHEIYYRCEESHEAYCTDTRPEPWRRVVLKGASAETLAEFVKTALTAYREHNASLKSQGGISMFAWDDHDGWVSHGEALPRTLDTLFLSGDQAPRLLEDLKNFVAAETRDVYARLSIPMVKVILLHGVPGSGKCLGRDTPVLTYDGSTKFVQDIEVGDALMGDDGTPRRVLGLGRGREEMFRLTTDDGESYTMNRSHIMCLVGPTGTVKEMSVNEYLTLSLSERMTYHGYRIPKIRAWAGVRPCTASEAYVWGTRGIVSPTLKRASIVLRREWLAGLRDASAFRIGSTAWHVTLTESMDPRDILFMARSVGFRAILDGHIVKITEGMSTTEYGFSLVSIGQGDYYGFEVDGNGRFCLGDLTVTHNTSLIRCIASELGLSVATYSGTDVDMFSDSIAHAPSRSLVAIDDIDCLLGSGNQREKNGFSKLLNVLDGVTRKEPLIVFMTTNFPGTLDIALKRRVDHCLEFTHATRDQAVKLIAHFFPSLDAPAKLWETLVAESSKRVPMSALQKFLTRSLKYGDPYALLRDDAKAFTSLVDVISPKDAAVAHMYA